MIINDSSFKLQLFKYQLFLCDLFFVYNLFEVIQELYFIVFEMLDEVVSMEELVAFLEI